MACANDKAKFKQQLYNALNVWLACQMVCDE
jgi:hypothetical protein